MGVIERPFQSRQQAHRADGSGTSGARARRRITGVGLALLLAACSSGPNAAEPPTPEVPDTTTTTTATTTTTTTTTAPPDTSAPDRARAALDAVLAWLDDPTTLDPSRFSDEFLAAVPASELAAVFETLGGGWSAGDVTSSGPDALAAELAGPGSRLVVQLSVDPDGRIAGLLFQPAGLDDPPETLDELSEQLAGLAPHAGFVRAELAPSGECVEVAALDADRPLPIGSVFKLYVLGAIAGAVANGELSWDQPVEIRDELDSLPSGTTQDEPAGSTLSVRELAQRMIEVSDNTATDHLIDLVGRDAVEAALTELGHSDPAASLPVLTTREMFVIKADADLLARYEAAGEDERRALLAGEVAGAPRPTLEELADRTVPRAVMTVEWFASPADVCRAFAGLAALAGSPGLEPVAEVLSANPGLALDPGTFTQVQFKGGSEPGVLFLAWLATRPDGSRIVVAGGVADEATEVDPRVVELLGLGLTLDQAA